MKIRIRNLQTGSIEAKFSNETEETFQTSYELKTGSCDENDQEIFTDDLVEFISPDGTPVRGVIRHHVDTKGNGFYFFGLEPFERIKWALPKKINGKVIGNIYELKQL